MGICISRFQMCFKKRIGNITIKEKSIVIVGMKKLTDNFYCIECDKLWTASQFAILKKNINYKLFSPISIPFINGTIYGASMKDSNNKYLPKFVMFN